MFLTFLFVISGQSLAEDPPAPAFITLPGSNPEDHRQTAAMPNVSFFTWTYRARYHDGPAAIGASGNQRTGRNPSTLHRRSCIQLAAYRASPLGSLHPETHAPAASVPCCRYGVGGCSRCKCVVHCAQLQLPYSTSLPACCFHSLLHRPLPKTFLTLRASPS
jgi:hypothetical protein